MTGPRVREYLADQLTPAGADVRWQEDQRRNCADVDPNVFFPNEPGGKRKPDYESKKDVAKRICAGCPVRQQCLDHAVKFFMVGIWAGTDDEERKTIRRNNRAGADQTRGAA